MSTKTGLTKNKKVIIPIILLAVLATAIIVLAYHYAIYYTPSSATSGSILTLQWVNSTPTTSPAYTPVQVYFNNTYITTVLTNSSGGIYNVQILVPYNLPAGSYNITILYNSQTLFGTTTLFNETFSLSPGFGSPGSTVQFTGFGFLPGETVKIYFDGQVVAAVTAGPSGYISGSFTVPSTASVGSHTVVAVGQTSGVTYVSLFYVTVASITLSKTIATVGSTVYVSGSGFPANQYVVLCFDNTVVNTAYTSSSGTFTTNFTVPVVTNNTYSVVAMATVSPVPIGAQCPYIGEAYEGGYASASLTVVPSLTVNVTTTCPTYAINVTGYGFPAGKPIEILVNGTNATVVEWSSSPSSLKTSSSGTFWAVIQMPPTPGTYEITTNVTFMGYPTPVAVQVTPPYVLVNGQSSISGIVGGTVTVSGACFPLTTSVNLYINSVEYQGVTQTNSTGGFSVNVNLPLLPPGTYKVYAQVNTITSVINASVTILAPQIVSVTPSSGYEGMCFNITGINFANATLYNATVTINGVTYTYGKYGQYQNYTTYACGTVYLFSNGTVILPVQVPVIPPGMYTVFVNSTVNATIITHTGVPSYESYAIVPISITAPNDTLYATASFTVQPSYITVTPSQAIGGQEILIQGYNFYPGTPVTIIINGTNATTATVGSNGQFSVTYTIPSYLTSGVLYIVAKENYTEYINGTPPNAVGYATATVTITNIYLAVLTDLTKLLQCCSSVNATLQQLMSEVSSVASEVSAVYSAVLSMNSTLVSMSSTLSNISSTLSSIQSTLTTIQSTLSGISNTLTTIQGTMTADFSTIISDLSNIQSMLTTINSTVEYYGNNILSAVQSIKTVVPSVSTGYGTLTFTSPGAQTIYQSSTVGQVTITLYYTGYSTVWIYVYPIPGDTTHVVKLQVMSSMGYTVTVSGWRVDIYVTSASSVSPVTVYYSYTAIS